MEELSFNVSARTARLIGRDNVGTAQAAIIELIKNGYDADSSQVAVEFRGGNIVIADSGEGMELSSIKDHWMRIGTDNKDISPLTKKGRVKSGAKGIGRFALDKLGSRVIMITRSKINGKVYEWSIDWELFDKPDISVNDVKATVKEVALSKFRSVQEAVGITDITGGTYLNISGLRETWTESDLNMLFSALESLVPMMENDEFAITMKSHEYPAKYGNVEPLVAEDYDYRVESQYHTDTKQIRIKIYRNELDLKALETKYLGVFDQPDMKKSEYQLDSFRKGFVEVVYDIEELIGARNGNDALDRIGDFRFDFIFVKNQASAEDKKKYPYRFVDYSARSAWLDQFSGVRIYRDNFRVRPYGEGGDDWLRLGERQAKSPQGAGQRIGHYRIRPNQISGAVMISRLDSTGLQDKSSREGIHEDESFRLLKTILIAIINKFEVDRNIVNYSISQEYLRINVPEATRQEGEDALKKVQKGDKGSDGTDGENAKALAAYTTTLKNEREELVAEIKVLRSLASAGLVTASAGHELWGYRNQLDTRADTLRTILHRYIPVSKVKDVDRAYNPYVHLDNIEKMDEYIAGWLSYALRPIRKDRRTAKTLYVNAYLESLRESWEKLLAAKRAQLGIHLTDKDVAIKMYPIDLDSIFNNLIINSIESFMSSEVTTRRDITISTEIENKRLLIHYKDSGDGLSAEYQKEPEKIFMPHETSKRDLKTHQPIGTGMGMYIVKSIIEESRNEIIINPPHSSGHGFSLTMVFRMVR